MNWYHYGNTRRVKFNMEPYIYHKVVSAGKADTLMDEHNEDNIVVPKLRGRC